MDRGQIGPVLRPTLDWWTLAIVAAKYCRSLLSFTSSRQRTKASPLPIPGKGAGWAAYTCPGRTCPPLDRPLPLPRPRPRGLVFIGWLSRANLTGALPWHLALEIVLGGLVLVGMLLPTILSGCGANPSPLPRGQLDFSTNLDSDMFSA